MILAVLNEAVQGRWINKTLYWRFRRCPMPPILGAAKAYTSYREICYNSNGVRRVRDFEKFGEPMFERGRFLEWAS